MSHRPFASASEQAAVAAVAAEIVPGSEDRQDHVDDTGNTNMERIDEHSAGPAVPWGRLMQLWVGMTGPFMASAGGGRVAIHGSTLSASVAIASRANAQFLSAKIRGHAHTQCEGSDAAFRVRQRLAFAFGAKSLLIQTPPAASVADCEAMAIDTAGDRDRESEMSAESSTAVILLHRIGGILLHSSTSAPESRPLDYHEAVTNMAQIAPATVATYRLGALLVSASAGDMTEAQAMLRGQVDTHSEAVVLTIVAACRVLSFADPVRTRTFQSGNLVRVYSDTKNSWQPGYVVDIGLDDQVRVAHSRPAAPTALAKHNTSKSEPGDQSPQSPWHGVSESTGVQVEGHVERPALAETHIDTANDAVETTVLAAGCEDMLRHAPTKIEEHMAKHEWPDKDVACVKWLALIMLADRAHGHGIARLCEKIPSSLADADSSVSLDKVAEWYDENYAGGTAAAPVLRQELVKALTPLLTSPAMQKFCSARTIPEGGLLNESECQWQKVARWLWHLYFCHTGAPQRGAVYGDWLEHHRMRTTRSQWSLKKPETIILASYLEPAEVHLLCQCSRQLRRWLQEPVAVLRIARGMHRRQVALLDVLATRDTRHGGGVQAAGRVDALLDASRRFPFDILTILRLPTVPSPAAELAVEAYWVAVSAHHSPGPWLKMTPLYGPRCDL